MNDVPDKACFDILIHLYKHLLLEGVKDIKIRYYDSSNFYPSNLLFYSGRCTSFKRWEILIENVDHDKLESILKKSEKVEDFNNCKFKIYSES